MGYMLNHKWYWSREGYIQHWCPGCNERHEIAIEGTNERGARWNISWEDGKATVSPSVLVSTNSPRNAHEIDHPVTYAKCHYFIINGRIQYLNDCLHALAGKVVDIPEFPNKLCDLCV
jgi:hypothetical protein